MRSRSHIENAWKQSASITETGVLTRDAAARSNAPRTPFCSVLLLRLRFDHAETFREGAAVPAAHADTGVRQNRAAWLSAQARARIKFLACPPYHTRSA